jgi:hypothetical protein
MEIHFTVLHNSIHRTFRRKQVRNRLSVSALFGRNRFCLPFFMAAFMAISDVIKRTSAFGRKQTLADTYFLTVEHISVNVYLL